MHDAVFLADILGTTYSLHAANQRAAISKPEEALDPPGSNGEAWRSLEPGRAEATWKSGGAVGRTAKRTVAVHLSSLSRVTNERLTKFFSFFFSSLRPHVRARQVRGETSGPSDASV